MSISTLPAAITASINESAHTPSQAIGRVERDRATSRDATDTDSANAGQAAPQLLHIQRQRRAQTAEGVRACNKKYTS